MEQTEIIYLIEDAEQGGDLHTIESGKAARVELDNMNKQLFTLREAGGKMAARLRALEAFQDEWNMRDTPRNFFTDDDAAALAEWEAANK